MSRFLPTETDTERAQAQLSAAEKDFVAALEHHERECRNGGEILQKAAARLAVASRAYRLALLDPRLPPI
jgi:hypothetical protein